MRLELRQSHRSKPAFLKTPSLSAAGESNREVFAAGNPALELPARRLVLLPPLGGAILGAKVRVSFCGAGTLTGCFGAGDGTGTGCGTAGFGIVSGISIGCDPG